jgi:hypothetical protein
MNRKAFTLVELLIVTTLMTFVSGVIVATLTGGFKVWARATEYGVHDQASLIASEGIRKDLASARRFRLIPFTGAYDEVSFPVVARFGSDASAPQEIGRLGYYTDSRRGLLCRSFVPYRLANRIRLRDRCEVVLEGVQKARFDYFGSETGEEDAGWSSSWESDVPPQSVKLSTTLDAGNRRTIARTALISLPSAPSVEKEE